MRSGPGNTRIEPVSTSRVFGEILQVQIGTVMDDKISKDQNGFIPSRGCIDHLFAVQ